MDSIESQKTLRILSSSQPQRTSDKGQPIKVHPLFHILHFKIADEVTAIAKTTYESLLTSSMQTLSAAA